MTKYWCVNRVGTPRIAVVLNEGGEVIQRWAKGPLMINDKIVLECYTFSAGRVSGTFRGKNTFNLTIDDVNYGGWLKMDLNGFDAMLNSDNDEVQLYRCIYEDETDITVEDLYEIELEH